MTEQTPHRGTRCLSPHLAIPDITVQPLVQQIEPM